MILTTFRHLSHTCTDDMSASIASFNEMRTLSRNTTAREWICNKENRVQSVNSTSLYVRNNESEFESVHNLIQSLPGQENATLTCPLSSCSYNGNYRITPTYSFCNGTCLSFSKSNCKTNTVALRTFQQDVSTLSWGLSHAWNAANRTSTEASIVAQRNCSAKNLLGPSTPATNASATPLTLGSVAVRWGIEPIGVGCENVNLYTMVGMAKMYLTMPNNCSINSAALSNVTSDESAFLLRPVP